MRIVSHKRLKEFYETNGHEDARVALERWYDIAEKAEWKNLSDIKVDFLSADYVGNQHYVFNVSSTNSKEFKLCVNSSFNIDTRLFRKTAIRSQCSKHVDNEIIETSMP